MELPHLGKHCSESSCRQLDYLPMKCDSCFKIFCNDHFMYARHNCEASYQKDVQVPVCPLCNEPVPGRRDEQADIRVGQHIDQECQSDPAKAKRKIYTNRCSVKGCKQKELVKVSCSLCQKNFCLKHRHFKDHNCSPITQAGAAAVSRNHVRNAATTVYSPPASTGQPDRAYGSSHAANVQPGMSEDEAFARALQLSLEESANPPPMVAATLEPSSQQEADRQLAEALAASQQQAQSDTRSTYVRRMREIRLFLAKNKSS